MPSASRSPLMPAGLGHRGRHRHRRLAHRPAARLYRRRLGAAARHRAARGRLLGRDDGDDGARDLRPRRFRPRRFQPPPDRAEARAPLAFWILLLAVWGALNAVFLGGDLFNLYVALELLTFAAVPLVCLDGRGRDARGRAALSAVRAARLGALPARHGAALRRLRHARHRPAGRPGPTPSRSACGCGGADDGGTAGQDRALPAASVAAARPCRRAGRRRAPCSRRWWSRRRSS